MPSVSGPTRQSDIPSYRNIKPWPAQNSWSNSVFSPAHDVAGATTGAGNMFGETPASKVAKFADLLSVLAGDTLNTRNTGGVAYQAANKASKQAAQKADKSAKFKPLPYLRHSPGSRTYMYYDPKTGPRNVTPFEDEIPGFDWHKDRNIFNMVPGNRPHPVYIKVWHGNAIGSELSHYEDHQGNRWNPNWRFFTESYHGKENLSFRGTGQYEGCQAVYTPEGKIMTTGDWRSTFDYGRPGTLGHRGLDMKPHDAPGGKSYRDPDLSRVF